MKRRHDEAQRPPFPEWVLREEGDCLGWCEAHGYDVFDLSHAVVAYRTGEAGASS